MRLIDKNDKYIDSIDDFKLIFSTKLSFIIFDIYKCTEEVLEYYITNYDDVNWYNISIYQTLSESFIDKHNDKVNWSNISKYQTLSEAFIIKYKDKVNWSFISRYQTLTESFIETHIDKLHLSTLFKNNKSNLSYKLAVVYLYDFNLYDIYKQLSNTIHKPVFNRLVAEFPDKFEIDKIAYEFNNNN